MTTSEIADDVLRSKKYKDVDRAVIERICTETIPKYVKQKDIIKAVKNELHIIHESFLQKDCHKKAEAILDNYSGADIKTDKDLSIRLMSLHASTNERLGQASEIYERISRYVSAEAGIIDIGCGFNPFALLFFKNVPKEYYALDISSSTVQVLDVYFRLIDLPYRAEICDAVANTPDVHCDVLFMFKLFPLLERQKKGRAFEILEILGCKTSIVSFPLKSASGKEKGMEVFYSNLFENDLPSGFVIAEKMIFTNEMFYVLEKVT